MSGGACEDEQTDGETLPMNGDPSTSDEAVEEEMLDTVFGREGIVERKGVIDAGGLKSSFAPWHHPVKQIVRDYQWCDLAKKLLEENRPEDERKNLRYFTLPGADLLDVRALSQRLSELKTSIEYFGFDAGYGENTEELEEARAVYRATEATLRQGGFISDNAQILPDRLEDIALAGSQADSQLQQQDIFDVINIDACDHLGYLPPGRSKSMFDAIERLLAHQVPAEKPWLLFVTTRVDPELMGAPAERIQGAISDNLRLHSSAFGQPLADCIGGKVETLATNITECWSVPSLNLMKIFSIGLAKYIMQFFYAQHNHPASVELISSYCYKVHGELPDMLALAFRIHPRGLKIHKATANGVSVIAPLELTGALKIVARAKKVWDLDDALKTNKEVLDDAVSGTSQLLAGANYDLEKWRDWLAGLAVRPIALKET